MNRTLIENWNRKVSAKDEIYILGDVTMQGPEYATEVLSQLKGRKYLIKGNHDRFVENNKFDSHYPIEEWHGYFEGAIHLYGRQHNHDDYNYKILKRACCGMMSE